MTLWAYESSGPIMSEPSAWEEGWSEEGNRISEGEEIEFAGGRLCNSWQHFCSCPCPEAREPSAGDFSSDLGKKNSSN